MLNKKYKKVKYLGKGSYGAALLVELKSNPSSLFVMKEIVIGHLSEAAQKSAKLEAEVLNKMTHSNITTYVESFVESSKLYIVMEYADGGDLSALIKERKAAKQHIPEEEIMRLFVQICLAIKHVHGHNILHRDLKSQNVFLTSSGVIKLGDFGIAKVLDNTDDQAQTQIGTPYYLSPEICNNVPYGRESDIWSIGVILYELMALDLPFAASSLPELMMKISSAKPPLDRLRKLNPGYSGAMIDLVQRILQKNPNDRPTINDIIHNDVTRLHINQLLSQTLQNNKYPISKVQAAVELEPDEADRELEMIREELKERELKLIRESKENIRRMERQQQREAEVEKLRKFKDEMMMKKASSVSLLDDGDEATVVKYNPRKPDNLADYKPPRAAPIENTNIPKRESANQIKAGIDNQLQIHQVQQQLQLQPRLLRVPSPRQGNSSNEYESIARREFLANRQAAQSNKEKVEAYERNYINNNSNRQQSNKLILPDITKEPVIQRRDSKIQVEVREKNSVFAEEDCNRNILKAGTGGQGQPKDEKEYLDSLAAVAREQRIAVRRIRELHGGPIAFSIDVNTSNTDDATTLENAVTPRILRGKSVEDNTYTKEDNNSRRSSYTDDLYSRGVKVIIESMDSKNHKENNILNSKSEASIPVEVAQDGNAKQRRSWGPPVSIADQIADLLGEEKDGNAATVESEIEEEYESDYDEYENTSNENSSNENTGYGNRGNAPVSAKTGVFPMSEEQVRNSAREALRKYRNNK